MSLTGFILGACSSKKTTSEKNNLKIVTSFYPVYALTKIVSGELNEISMIQSKSGIHDFEPSASDMAKIYEADVFIYHAHTLENWASDIDPNLQDSDVQVIEASAQMTLDRVKGLEDVTPAKGQDEASLYDPHTWNDPIKAAEEAKLIAKALGEIDPNHAEIYAKNAEQFEKEAKALVERYEPKFSQAKSKYFVTSHTAFSYLAKRFGLEQLGIAGISTEQEPTSRQLAEIENFVKDYGVKTIFVEQGVSTKIAETVAKATGAKVTELSPLEFQPNQSGSYLEHLETNLVILLNALNEDPSGKSEHDIKSDAGKKTESKTMSQIDAEEGLAAEQVVIKITDEGYVTSHGDHFHYYTGQVPYDALISKELLIADPNYQLNEADIVNELEEVFIIKVKDSYAIILKENSTKNKLR